MKTLYIAIVALGLSAVACSKSDTTSTTGATAPGTPAAAQPAPAKVADAKTGKQLMPGKWKMTKAVIDGKDLTAQLGAGAVTTFTDSSMTQKIGSSDVNTPFTVLKDAPGSAVIKDNKGNESTLTFEDATHLSLTGLDHGSKIAMTYEKL